MKEESVTDASLREFLLGKLTDEERERIENLFLTDPQTRERVLILEEDLIEDYLEDGLTETDKQRFLTRYAQTDEQRRKLRVTKSIKDWALAQAREPKRVAATVTIWNRLWTRLRSKPAVVIPIAAMIVIGLVLASVWLNSRMERRKYLAVEQELAHLNSPASLRETPPFMTSFELKPVTVRGIEPETEIDSGGETRVVEMRLPWIRKDRYATYQVEVRRTDDQESFSIGNLQAENNSDYRIRLRLPVHILHRGSYQILITGIANDIVSAAEEYTFTVK